jgi:hypothetical protein
MEGLKDRNVHGSKSYFSYPEYLAYRDQNQAVGVAGTRLATGVGSSIARPVLTAAANDSRNHNRVRSLPAMTRATGRRAS